jgi:sporulation protein YlmC with PRC-barrel domain
LWLAVGMASLAVVCQAQSPDTTKAAAAEMLAELVGAPVYAVDGEVVGTVEDILFDDEWQPALLLMRTAAQLGFGSRIVEIPQDMFTTLRGALVLEMPATAVGALREHIERAGEK